MTTRYERSIALPGLTGLGGVATIRNVVLSKVAIKRETAQIETGDRKIDERSLVEAADAVESADRLQAIHVELFTCREDELAVAITHVSSRRLLRRRGTVHVQVRGTDEVSVLGLAGCLERFRDQRRQRGSRSPAISRKPGVAPAGHVSPRSRTWWWHNITVGAAAQIVATMLIALGSMLWWALVRSP
jgi:hypothetical protein